ncbi:MAG: segregation/condensation protein A [Acidobacteriota bacterium]|nr:segregation/condensation protein A [Acidobacteriota bacterium]
MSRQVGTDGSLPDLWRVRLPSFEGPLDLLLHLVRINQVEITDIPVALICDQFHEYLGLMGELSIDVAADYVYEAAMLVHLKSRMLLPRPKAEDGAEEDPREELVARLLEYEKLKEAAQSLAEIHSLRRGVLTRDPEKIDSASSDDTIDLGEISMFDLLGAFKQLLNRYEREHPPPFLVRSESFSVKDQFERLLNRLEVGKPLDVLADLRHLSCRAEAIATFLALLELARLDLVRVHQTGVGDLLLYRTKRQLELHELEALQA